MALQDDLDRISAAVAKLDPQEAASAEHQIASLANRLEALAPEAATAHVEEEASPAPTPTDSSSTEWGEAHSDTEDDGA